MTPTRALVRLPGDSYPQALTRLNPVPPVDLALAREQHAQYVDALRACGLAVIELPPDHDRPDAVFTQDPVLVVDGRAIVARPAVESRQREAGALVAVLERDLPSVELRPPATLDGGDVLITDERLYVGLSTRSNPAACEQLVEITGRPVDGVPVPEPLLHLLTGCTYLGENRLLVVESLAAAFGDFETIVVPDDEEPAANVLIVGRQAIVPAGYPKVAVLVERCGYQVHLVPIGEYEKRDGGVTCLSLLF
jgi:dimethylargininase